MVREYEAVENYAETGRTEIVCDGEPISHIPYTESSEDDLAWGYNGAGPHNTARSILEHAAETTDKDITVTPNKHRADFRAEYIAPQNSSEDGWTIAHADVVAYLKNRES